MILYLICSNTIMCSSGQFAALTAHEKCFVGFYVNELGDHSGNESLQVETATLTVLMHLSVNVSSVK